MTTCLVEEAPGLEKLTGVQCEATLVQSDDGGLANVVLSNTNGYSCCVRAGQAVGVTLVEPASDDVQLPLDDPATDDPANVYVVMSQSERGQLLKESVGKPSLLSVEQAGKLHELLDEFHLAFSLETDLVEMEIHTGCISCKANATHRSPGSYPAIPEPMGQPDRDGTQERRLTPLLCGLQAVEHGNEIGHIPIAPSRRPTRPARGRTVLYYPRFGKWLLANPCRPRISREDGIRCSPWPV